jgi:hypothetical protein
VGFKPTGLSKVDFKQLATFMGENGYATNAETFQQICKVLCTLSWRRSCPLENCCSFFWPGEEVVISVDEWAMDYVAEEQEC